MWINVKTVLYNVLVKSIIDLRLKMSLTNEYDDWWVWIKLLNKLNIILFKFNTILIQE